jgi:hypothetical protein
MRRFEYLSKNGDSNCSRQFMESIPNMAATGLNQGFCCNPMDAHRYVEQVKGLRRYRCVPPIRDDPYNIPADLAAKLITQYDLALGPAQQARCDYAMENADERGPCCCQCRRWQVSEGLAKQLITDHDFSGDQIVEVWNLSDGCDGHFHS